MLPQPSLSPSLTSTRCRIPHRREWTKLAVERMLACGTCLMGVRCYCCASPDCTHARFFCQTCESKACSSCGLKGTEQWIAEQQHILPDCDWQHKNSSMT
ncbi:transposase zinc-binding domain-containing protein [Serratia nevei]|uniref:transposase zinc-binding domain-containing protein n=1 Tax=unclassified Serratia (in: enterobacteria) TaxID=2647522 RepID=UPI0020CCFB80|nr:MULTISPECIES: transposase zinc-binding domain-containing protein [unclassified Serratia (in: enterobacteria)]